MRYVLILILSYILTISCSDIFTSSDLKHLYGANLQDTGDLTGIHVVLEENEISNDIMSILMMGYTSLEFFLNDDNVYKTYMNDGCDYFAPLEPGTHVFVHQEKVKGAAVIIGVPWGMCRKEYQFTLDEGQIGQISFKRDSDACLQAFFVNVEDSSRSGVLKTGYFYVD